MKVVINVKFGGFSISQKAAEFMAARGNERAKQELAKECDRWYGFGSIDGMDGEYDRTDPDLIAAVETLGREADGERAQLRVVEIPDGIKWEIDNYDGNETIAEARRTWK